MPLLLTEDQEVLAANAQEVLAAAQPAASFRTLRAAGQSHDAALWAQLVEQGWPAIPVPEARGGLGLGLPEVAVIMEALGRHLAATPMASAAPAAVADPSFDLTGGAVLALAWREAARGHDPLAIQATARSGRVSGRKRAVLHGGSASAFVVSALEGGVLQLFRVEASAAQVLPLSRIDHLDAVDLVLDEAPAERLDRGEDTLREALRHLAVGLAAEQLGGMQAMLDLTVAYLKERHQFGVPIGSFQVLQHRAVDAFMQVELCRATVLQAAREPTPTWVDLARLKCGEVGLKVAKEAIQLHGGIGMTDECDVGLYAKRAMVAAFG